MASVDPASLKVGLYLPNGDGVMSPGIHRWADVVRFTTMSEAAGLDSVWVADHMVFVEEGYPTEGRWECWQLLAAMAATTNRVEIGPLVTCTAFRNPAHLAKIAETTDEISNGRLVLALGAGWHEPEFTTYGFPYDHRASRFEEAFRIIADMIRTGSSDFQGTYYQTHGAEMHPRGPRNGGIPIIVGTDGPRLLELTARQADGWNTTWTRSAPEILPRLAALDAACDRVGRDPATIGRSACIFVEVEGAQGIFTHQYGVQPPNPRSADGVAELLAGYAEAGIDHVMVWLDPYTEEGVARLADGIQRLRG